MLGYPKFYVRCILSLITESLKYQIKSINTPICTSPYNSSSCLLFVQALYTSATMSLIRKHHLNHTHTHTHTHINCISCVCSRTGPYSSSSSSSSSSSPSDDEDDNYQAASDAVDREIAQALSREYEQEQQGQRVTMPIEHFDAAISGEAENCAYMIKHEFPQTVKDKPSYICEANIVFKYEVDETRMTCFMCGSICYFGPLAHKGTSGLTPGKWTCGGTLNMQMYTCVCSRFL